MTLVGYAGYAGSLLTLSPAEFDIDQPGLSGRSAVCCPWSALPFIAVGLVAAMVSMVLRMRRSQGVQRQQLRLMALSVAFVALSFVFLLVVQLFNGGRQTWISSLPLFFSYFCLPLLFAVAVLRYRLFDLDLIINRAVVLALGTIFAGIGYTGLVLAVAALLNTQTSGFWLSLLATALVALAFQPLRQRIVRFANRLAYGARALPYEALSEFSRRLAEPPSPNALLPAVAEAAGRAVSARSSTAVLQVPGLVGISDVWPGPADGAPEYQVPVRQGGDTLGSIGVTMPKGRGLRPADERLLQDLADQTALAFRNAAMESELAGHVAALDRTTDALAESRRRIIAADDAARRRLESAISRDVLSHLQPMPGRLSGLSVPKSGSAATDELEQLVDETNAALESLRALTRGLFPTQLARAGLARALRSHLARNGQAVTLHVEPSADRRFAARVEAAVYFCCVEAVRAGSVAARIDLRIVAAGAGRADPLARPRPDRRTGDRRPGRGGGRTAAARPRRVSCRSAFRSKPASPRGSEQVRTERGLGQVRRSSTAGDVELVLVIGREQYDDRRIGVPGDPPGGLDAVDAGQVDVHQHETRAQPGDSEQRLLAG